MTTPKAEIKLSSRLTAYVTREEGAAELRVSPSTWDDMVDGGILPKPRMLGRMRNIPRWCWAEVDEAIRNGHAKTYLQPEEPYFREQAGGPTKSN
jgi:predicted DNA-binding transcriptional regulator AlpA